jgi:hypothetical protein
VGAENQGKQVSDDPRYLESVEERLQPVARVAVAGQDNSALKIESAGPPPRPRRSGERSRRL